MTGKLVSVALILNHIGLERIAGLAVIFKALMILTVSVTNRAEDQVI